MKRSRAKAGILLLLAGCLWTSLGPGTPGVAEEETLSAYAAEVLEALRVDDTERLRAHIEQDLAGAAAAARELEEAGHEPAAATLHLKAGQLAAGHGQPVRGLEHLESAERLYGEAGDDVGRGRALYSMAVIHENLRAWTRAIELARASARTLAAAEHPYHETRALILVGRILVGMGEGEDAVRTLTSAVEKARATKHPALMAEACEGMAHLFYQSGEYAMAAESSIEAARLWRKVEAPDAAAGAWNLAGLSFAEQEKYTEAIKCHRLALALIERRGNDYALAHTYWYLAESLTEIDEAEDALALFHRAHELLVRSTAGLTPEQGAGAREHTYWLYEMAIGTALDCGRLEDACFFAEALRGRALVEAMAQGRQLLAAVPPDLERELRNARRAEAAAFATLGSAREKESRASVREAERAYEASRARVQDVVTRIRRRSAVADDTYREVVRPKELQALLAPDEVVVLYMLGSEEAGACVLTRETLDIVLLGETRRLLAAVEELYEQAQVPGTGGDARAEEGADEGVERGVLLAEPTEEGDGDWRAARDRLVRLLVVPLGLPPHGRKVFVSPHRSLHSLPFSFLIPDRDVVHVPSLTTLAFLRRRVRAEGVGVLAIGNPEIAWAPSRVPENLTRAGLRLGPLKQAGIEARTVGTLVFTGAEATESQLRTALSSRERWKAVHLACHGVVTPETPLLSALALAPDEEHDGFLTLLDVYGLPVHADLVALSACDSGVGRAWLVEGLVGFPRAFLAAGAQAVLVSLVPVDDRATRVLMTEFYRLWNPKEGEGTRAPAALRAAQAKVRATPGWEHPRYWAPWVLWGLVD